MVGLCPTCWSELATTPTTCRNCGNRVDVYSRDYERSVVAALPHSSPERRAQICWILGMRGKSSSAHPLVGLLNDPDVLVRVAALRALGEIGDESAIPAVEKEANGNSPATRLLARQVLAMLRAAPAK